MFRVSLFDFFVRNVIIISKAPAARKTARCRAIAEKTGLFYTIHLDENLNVSDFNPHVAQAYRRTVEETVALVLAAAMLPLMKVERLPEEVAVMRQMEPVEPVAQA